MRRILGGGVRLHGTNLHYAAHALGVLHGIERDHQSYVGVPYQVRIFDSEMPADGLKIVHVLLDAARELRDIGYRVGQSAIPHIVENQCSPVAKMPEIFQKVKSVGDDHCLGTAPDLLEVQTNSVFHFYETVAGLHVLLVAFCRRVRRCLLL
jgi:hypothetical protein